MDQTACPPNCYAKVVEAVAVTQHGATQDKLDVIIENQSKIDHSVQRVAEAIIIMGGLSKQFDEHKVEADKKFDFFYGRWREMDQTTIPSLKLELTKKATSDDVKALAERGYSWIWDVVKLLGAGVVGAIINHKMSGG